MKKQILTPLFLSLFLITAFFNKNVYAQVPQAFKYQTILRNASGEILANQTISLRLSILQGSETGTAVYTETWDKTTNAFGLIVLNVGEGTSNDDFSSIAWGADVYYLKAEIDQTGGTNYTDAGTSQLLSVPYALYAGSSANSAESPWQQKGSSIYYNAGNVGIGTSSPNKKLVIKATSNNDTLMEILDKDGNPLVVITPQLTKFNIIPENASAAGASGGFAVGRYALAKKGKASENNNLLLVTPDSTRVYTIQETAEATGNSGGFAVGHYISAQGDTTYNFFTDVDSTKVIIPKESTGIQGGFAVLGSTEEGNEENIFDVSTGVVESINKENRMLWYPQKNAFMAGYLNVPSANSVGINSFNVGYNCIASGNYSSAMGMQTRASGLSSTAIGAGTTASGANSTAMGYQIKVKGNHSFGIGLGLNSALPIEINQSNTMAIMGGNVGIATVAPSLTFEVNGSVGGTSAWQISSDKRFKKDIRNLNGSLEKVLKLRGVNYYFKQEEFPNRVFGKGKQIGVIAQEVEKILPEVVKTDDKGYKSVQYSKFTPILIEAIKEQHAEIEKQNKKIDSQADEIEKLKQENKKIQILEQEIEALKKLIQK